MDTILTIVGIFAGIGAFLAAAYALVQSLLLEGLPRWVNIAVLVLLLIVMGALHFRHVALARVLSVALVTAAGWAFVIEPRWYKIFPLLIILFSVVVMLGYVHMSPLPE